MIFFEVNQLASQIILGSNVRAQQELCLANDRTLVTDTQLQHHPNVEGTELYILKLCFV